MAESPAIAVSAPTRTLAFSACRPSEFIILSFFCYTAGLAAYRGIAGSRRRRHSNAVNPTAGSQKPA